jgi:Fe2+ or Zn2+ uptake regulation protein
MEAKATATRRAVVETCRRLFDIAATEFNDVAGRIEAGHGFEIHPRRVAMVGVCKSWRGPACHGAQRRAPLLVSCPADKARKS